MEQLKAMKQTLMSQAQSQMGNLQQVDAKELGEVVDMIKDLEEAIYYCTIVEAMEKDSKEKEVEYYTERRDMDYPRGRMYYSGSSDNGYGSRNYREPWQYYYTERPMDFSIRDPREGRSPMQRRMYMEAHGQNEKMVELEKYMQELTGDIMEMIKEATPEEKKMLQQKISTLATKI